MYTSGTGYYLPTDDEGNSTHHLKHCHALATDQLTPQWHSASQIHLDDPTAHTNARAFSADDVRWAKANANLSQYTKRTLIADAENMHRYKLSHYGDI